MRNLRKCISRVFRKVVSKLEKTKAEEEANASDSQTEEGEEQEPNSTEALLEAAEMSIVP